MNQFNAAPFNTLAGDPVPSARAFWLRAEDGIRLRAAHWPSDQGYGSVLMLPGRTEYVEKYNTLALDLNSAGFDVLSLDWRGQGLSDRLLPDPRAGHVGHFSDYQRDLVELLVAADEIGLRRPWHMLAHSMGGAIGLAALIDGLPVNSVAFSAPMWGINLSASQLKFAMTATWAGISAGRAAIPAPFTGGYVSNVLTDGFLANRLTGDGPRWGRIVAEHASWPDLVTAGPTNQWLRQALIECARLATAPSPRTPAIVALGTAENIVSGPAIRRRVAEWPGAELLEFEGGRHEPLMERDTIRTPFLEAVVAHFDAHA